MKKVLVLGDAIRLEEFKKLNLLHAEVTYQEYASLEDLNNEWAEQDDEFEEEDEEDFVFLRDEYEETEDDEDDDIILDGSAEIESFETEEYDIIFDLHFDEDPNSLTGYLFNEGQIVIGCAVKRSLAELVGPWGKDMSCKLIGMNALPTFIDRPKLEMSLLDRADLMVLEATMKTLGLEYELVDDQVGMVTPRVVSMIINEAAFVLGEGTAEVAAVDQAMKLGTNYPKGPFEWCDAIGAVHVVEVLQALQKQFGDGKYKIAPALMRHYHNETPFYPVG